MYIHVYAPLLSDSLMALFPSTLPFLSLPPSLPAVGKAFGEECIVHPDILKFLFGEEEDDPTSPRRKMAHVSVKDPSQVYMQHTT